MEKKNVFQKKNSLTLSLLAIFLGCSILFITVKQASCATTQTAVVATAAADYSSGAHSIVSVDPVGGPRTVQNDLLPTSTSDITVAAYGQYFFRIEKYFADNVTKFDIIAPDTVIWQFSTMDDGEEVSSNPHDLIFADSEKAYLLRYGKTKAWIVNPSATTEAEFKIGELDLSSYADSDGIPEMHSGVIVDNKLFIILQRIDRDNNWAQTNTTYLAVYDTTTNTEIDTGIANTDGVLGIALPIKNPGAIQYLEENSMIYVQGSGQTGSTYFGTASEYSGGIVRVNPSTYDVTQILDDDTDGDGTPLHGGNIVGMTIVSATKGYFASYAGWGDNTLYSFNPATGEVNGAVIGLENKNIAGMESGVYVDQNNMLWVCNQTDARIDIVNTADDTIDESVSTNLNPIRVVFTNEGTAGTAENTDVTDEVNISCFITTTATGPQKALQMIMLSSLIFGTSLIVWITVRISRKK